MGQPVIEDDQDQSLIRAFAAVGELRQRIELAAARMDALTPREREVLLLLAEGASNREIADTLGLSPRTVEIHRRRMLIRLGTPNLPDALKIAFYASLPREIGSDPAGGHRRRE